MNKANILRLTVAFATLVTVMIASGQGRPGAVKAPQVPRAAPQVQYTVIDLGTDGVGNQITDSGRIVGSINFGGPDRDAAFWPTPRARRLISAHCQVSLGAGDLALIRAARS